VFPYWKSFARHRGAARGTGTIHRKRASDRGAGRRCHRRQIRRSFPLCRQAQIYARQGIELARSWGGTAPPAVAYVYAPDRNAERPVEDLKGFHGILQVDGYAGYGALAETGTVDLAFCWTHWRRKCYELPKLGNAPIASEALSRIAAIYAIKAEIRGRNAQARQDARQQSTSPLLSDLHAWLEAQLITVFGKSKIAEAIRYGATRCASLRRFLDDGRIEIGDNAVDRAIRPIALNRKNALFAGSDEDGEDWAISPHGPTSAISSNGSPAVIQSTASANCSRGPGQTRAEHQGPQNAAYSG
jgi:hypothetical protein